MCSVGTRGGGKKEGGKVGRGWSRKGRRDGAYDRGWRRRGEERKGTGDQRREQKRGSEKLWERKCAENSFVPLPSFQLAPAAPSVLSSYTPSPLLLDQKFTRSPKRSLAFWHVSLKIPSSLLPLWAHSAFSLTFSLYHSGWCTARWWCKPHCSWNHKVNEPLSAENLSFVSLSRLQVVIHQRRSWTKGLWGAKDRGGRSTEII